MQLLILGGTAWLGREIARDAAGRGHAVTCLARGTAGPAADDVRLVAADRDRPDAYDAVRQVRWDAVLDVSRQPGHVRRAVAALEPVAERYLFVSTGSVYAGHRTGADEDAALLPPLTADVMASADLYGEAKVACEQAVTRAFGPDRTLLARAALIGGPGDWSGRSGYWPWRFAHPSTADGAVLVPDAPEAPAAVLDVRDLASWLVGCAKAGVAGVFNVAGEPRPLPEHLDLARTVAGHTGPLVPAESGWLTEHGVQNWMGPTSLPLWIADPDWYGLNAPSTARARGLGAAALRCRPLEQTLADTLAWEDARDEPGPHGAGLTDDEERELIALLRGSAAGRRQSSNVDPG